MLDAESLRTGLRTKLFGKKIYSFETIDSTNTCGRAVAACGAPEGTIVIAEEQTEGKGRQGRSWVANPGENLMFSVLLRPGLPTDQLNLFPFYAAVAVSQGVERETSLRVECKWPNDLLLGGRKFAGILLQGSVDGSSIEYLVLGIGINVNQSVFPPELDGKATSLLIEGGRRIDRMRLLRTILQSLEDHYAQISRSGLDPLLSEWKERTPMLNKPVSVLREGETITGIMKGVTRQGGMVLAVNGTEQILHAGDVTILRT
ncbi:MAG: biotin--[acetyl-CoA-carboxylase] ligase [Ignavibacteria bacterium]|nr:biotin--[acetyl-CoA-carboxylase] ligase [Ignavibacteria bacterium]